MHLCQDGEELLQCHLRGAAPTVSQDHGDSLCKTECKTGGKEELGDTNTTDTNTTGTNTCTMHGTNTTATCIMHIKMHLYNATIIMHYTTVTCIMHGTRTTAATSRMMHLAAKDVEAAFSASVRMRSLSEQVIAQTSGPNRMSASSKRTI
jgi:hypothetical protein